MPVPSLPTETLGHILDSLAEHHLTADLPYADLARCCLVSKTFTDLATSLLYEDVEVMLAKATSSDNIGGESDNVTVVWTPPARSFALRPSLHTAVREFRLRGELSTLDDPNIRGLFLYSTLALVKACPRLTHLLVDAYDGATGEVWEWLAAVGHLRVQTLRSLSCHLWSHAPTSIDVVLATLVNFPDLDTLSLGIRLDVSAPASSPPPTAQLQYLYLAHTSHLPLLTHLSASSASSIRKLDLGFGDDDHSSAFSAAAFVNLKDFIIRAASASSFNTRIVDLVRRTTLERVYLQATLPPTSRDETARFANVDLTPLSCVPNLDIIVFDPCFPQSVLMKYCRALPVTHWIGGSVGWNEGTERFWTEEEIKELNAAFDKRLDDLDRKGAVCEV